MTRPDPLAEALAPTAADLGMAAECGAIGREFPGWHITWTSRWGFRATREGRPPVETASGSALRCHLALIEHREASA